MSSDLSGRYVALVKGHNLSAASTTVGDVRLVAREGRSWDLAPLRWADSDLRAYVVVSFPSRESALAAATAACYANQHPRVQPAWWWRRDAPLRFDCDPFPVAPVRIEDATPTEEPY